jgi:serine/threonine-protein kinase
VARASSSCSRSSNLGTEDDRYLVDNIDEDVVDLLSVVPNLLVRPRGETARYARGARDVRELGRSLGADVVVDASLRRLGGNVRISFRVITVQDGFQLWAHRYERAPTDVLSVADEAAHEIASVLTADLAAAPRARTTTPEAEELYLRGRYLLRRGWHEAIREASDVLARAHAIAPADPRIMGTYAFALSRAYGLAEPGVGVGDQARALASAATALDPSTAEANVALGILELQDQDAEAAVHHLCAALAIAPNCADALDWLGSVLGEVGRIDEAIALLGKVGLVDPEAVHGRFGIGRLCALTGDYEGMRAALGEIPAHRGDAASWFAMHARFVLWRRDAAEAERLEPLFRARDLPKSARFAVESCLSMVRGKLPPLEDAELLDQALPIGTSRTRRRASFNAQIRTELFAFAGLPDRAINALSEADRVGLFDLFWVKRCPLFDGLRDRSDFRTLEENIRLRADGVAASFDQRASRTGF